MATVPDDIKYTQRYNDLKRKVKEIELDNDRLHLKVLKTKKNIQRLHLERAILYERLSAIPPPPNSSSQPSPPLPPPRHPHSRTYPPSRPTSPPANVNPLHPDPYQQPQAHRVPSIPPPSNEEYRSPPSSSTRHPPSSRSPYPSVRPSHERERDRELGGPGLPPMRSHPHPPPYMNSSPISHPRPHSPPPPSHHHHHHSSNGYSQYSPEERSWERERDRETERDREYAYRDRNRVEQQHNGYPLPPQPYPPQRYDPHPPRYDHGRYDPHPAHPQSPPMDYDSRSHHSHSRRSSTSYSRDYPPLPPHTQPHAGPYEYTHHAPPPENIRRPEDYEYEHDDRRQAQQQSRMKERDRELPVNVPRVRDGEAMD